MAVLPMSHFSLCAMRRDRKKIMEYLQRLSKIEIISPTTNEDVFCYTNMDDECCQLEDQLGTVEASLNIIDKYAFKKSPPLAFLNGPIYKSKKEYDDFYNEKPVVIKEARLICSLDEQLDNLTMENVKIAALQEQLVPWKKLTVPLDYSGSKNTTCYIGVISGDNTKDAIISNLVQLIPEISEYSLEIVSNSKEQACIQVVVLKKYSKELKQALDELGFSYPLNLTSTIPSKELEELALCHKKNEAEIETVKLKIIEMAKNKENISFLAEHLKIRIEKYHAINSLKQSKYTFVLEGYVLSEDAPLLNRSLIETFDCTISCKNLEANEDSPTALRNNWFAEPVEKIVESYAYPTKDEIDPTSVMSIFYYIMFGLMFSDAGYGLILAATCGYCLLKFKNMSRDWSLNIRLFFWCGVSTIFWGIIFSSYFGDAVDAVSSNFFGKALTIPPVWFRPLDNPMKLLTFCLGVGIIHLTMGYIMNAAQSIKNKDYPAILYDCVFQIGILAGLLVVFMNTEMFEGIGGFKLSISTTTSTICMVLVAICSIGILFTNGRESKNWFKRLLKGTYALYNVFAGWLSDILSYSRLLALGLATGIIGTVVNTLGTMLGKGVIAAIGFVIIFLFGHALNFGINILGAYVHSNRLEYVEFFGKFYKGGGRKFSPFGSSVKNYKIMEDVSNG